MAAFSQGALIEQVEQIATAAGTTTLTNTNKTWIRFTGSLSQTVVLPAATTLTKGRYFHIKNDASATASTPKLTIQTNGGAVLTTILPGVERILFVHDVGTSAGSWVVSTPPDSIEPLKLTQSPTTPDTKLYIATNQPEANDRTISSTPPIDSTLVRYPNDTAAYVTLDLSSGVVSLGTTVRKDGGIGAYTLPTTTIGNFRRVAFAYVSSSNIVDSSWSAESATQAGLSDPGLVFGNLVGLNLGYVDLQAVTSTTYKTAGSSSTVIENSGIYRFASGAGTGGSGTGDITKIEVALRDTLASSPYEYVTPNVIATSTDTLFVGPLVGVSLDRVSSTLKFIANAQVATSVQMADVAEMFISSGKDIGQIDLVAFWRTGTVAGSTYEVPTAFTYAVSRDGGNNYQTVTMTRNGTTNQFRGSLVFTAEGSNQTIITQTTSDGDRALNATTQQATSQQFTLASPTVLQDVTVRLTKTGSPTGNFYVSIYQNTAGNPSTSVDAVLAQSLPILCSSLVAGPADLLVDIPDTTLAAGTYHMVVSTDATYKAGFSAGVTQISLRDRSTGSSAPFLDVFDGSAWTTGTGNSNLYTIIKGRALDLRVRITSAGSPAYPCGLTGFGIFYNLQDSGVVTAARKTQRFVFNSVTDNTSTFAITAFNPDPDLLTCYWVEGGQVFKVPAFGLNGASAVFLANTFYNGGVSQTTTLIFDQNSGGAFDNSDSNGRLLSANHLGSTSGADDKSAVGRGIYLRRPDGTLREIAIDNNDNIVILSVP